MELIFELFDRSGRVLERHKVDKNRISIGRAYNNQLILSDPTISPHHAVIDENESGNLVIRDLKSLNGIRIPHKDSQESIEIISGEIYQIGNSRVRICLSDHEVAEAVKNDEVDSIVDMLGRSQVLFCLIFLVTATYSLQQWLNMFSGLKWQGIANTLLLIFASAIVTAVFWGFVGRIIRHEIHFKAQLSIILVFILSQAVIFYFHDLILFNTLNIVVSKTIFVIADFVALLILFWFNLLVATNQNKSQRLKTASVLSLVLISLSLYSEITSYSDFSDRPDYVKTIKRPSLLLADGVSEQDFLLSAENVFSRIESD